MLPRTSASLPGGRVVRPLPTTKATSEFRPLKPRRAAATLRSDWNGESRAATPWNNGFDTVVGDGFVRVGGQPT